MFINQISASKSDIIDQCLWKYYLKYVEKLEGLESKNEEALNFGSFIHKIFEVGLNEKDTKSLAKIAESIRGTYKIPFQMNDRITKCIENFLVWNSKLGETVSTEKLYKLPLDEKNDIHFVGVIDRVIRGTDGSYLVIDYKTSKKQKSKKELLQDKQLMGYAYTMHCVYGVEFSKIYCAHYYPLTNTFIPVRFSKFQIMDWKRKEIDKVWRIRKKKKGEFPAMQNIFCDWCEFKDFCPRFQSEDVVCTRVQEHKEAMKAKKLEESNNSQLGKDGVDKEPNNESSTTEQE